MGSDGTSYDGGGVSSTDIQTTVSLSLVEAVGGPRCRAGGKTPYDFRGTAGTDATAGGHRLGKETVRTADELALTRLVLSRWQPARRADLRWLNLE